MKKQANNIETEKLQLELKDLLKKVGWSKKDLAEKIAATEENRSYDEDDPNKEYEKLRKSLNRKSTKPETLNRYINFVIESNKRRDLYRIPEPDMTKLNKNEQEILKSVGEIAYSVFKEEQNYC